MRRCQSIYSGVLRFGCYGKVTTANINPFAFVDAVSSGDKIEQEKVLKEYSKNGRKILKALANSLRRHLATEKGKGISGKIVLVLSCTESSAGYEMDMEVINALCKINPERWERTRKVFKQKLESIKPAKLHIHFLVDVSGGSSIINDWLKKYWYFKHKYGSVAVCKITSSQRDGWWTNYTSGQKLIIETITINQTGML